MVQSLGGIALAIGAIGILSSVVFMFSLDYPSPPFPAGYIVGMAMHCPGGRSHHRIIHPCNQATEGNTTSSVDCHCCIGSRLGFVRYYRNSSDIRLELPQIVPCPSRLLRRRIRASRVPKPLREFAMEGGYATTETSGPVTVTVKLDGMGKIVANVHLPFKADNATNVRVAGTGPPVTSVTRAILVRTVMFARRDGFQKPIA